MKKSMAMYCEVCTDQFSKEVNIPRILKCGHTFCECCLDKIKRQIPLNRGMVLRIHWTICCPKCKINTVLESPSNTASSLPKNFNYLDLIEDVGSLIAGVNDTINKTRTIQQEKCPKHPDYILDMFCEDEEEAVCLKCTIYGQHKKHQVYTLSNFSDQQKMAIECNRTRVNDLIKDCEDLTTQLQDRCSYIEKKNSRIRRYIVDMFTSIQKSIKAKLDAKLEQILNELNEVHEVQSGILEDNCFTIVSQTTVLERLKYELDNFLSQASQCDIAKEKYLVTDVQMHLDLAQNEELTSMYMYEVRIDDTIQILKTIEELVDAWVCTVQDTGFFAKESIGSLQEKFSSNCFRKSLQVLFDEESVEQIQNPFAGIDCEYSLYSGE